MKKRVKIFQAGKYPQGDFDKERISKIFNGVDKVSGIYAHTSKWIEKGEEPLTIGEFSNFKIDREEVTAEVEFNSKGEQYFNDGVIRGISVEIRDDELSKIAMLPIGVKPQILGAEFQEEDYAMIEFEEIIEENLSEKVKALDLGQRMEILKSILGSLTNDEKESIRQTYWADFEKKEVPKAKTEQEIRTEIALEFEKKLKSDKLKSLAKTKIIPILQPIVEFAIDKALEEKELIEFENDGKNDKVTYFEKFEEELKLLPDAVNFKSEVERMEFEEEQQDYMKLSFDEAKKITGGMKK